MTDKQGSDTDTLNGLAGEPVAAGPEAELLGRLRDHLAVLRGQVRRLNDSLATLNGIPTPEEAPMPDMPREAAAAAKAEPGTAGVSTRLAPAQTISLNHRIGLELGAQHMQALIQSGVLSKADAGNAQTVEETVQNLLDTWAQRYAKPAAKPDAREAKADRRAGRDRRHAGKRFNSLLSHIEGSALDRRKSADRRAGAERRARASDTTAGRMARGAPETNPPRSANIVDMHSFREGRTWRTLKRPAAHPVSSGGAAPGKGAGRVDDQAQPDQGERHQPVDREWLPVRKDGEQEMTGRRQVLEKADRREADPARRGDE